MIGVLPFAVTAGAVAQAGPGSVQERVAEVAVDLTVPAAEKFELRPGEVAAPDLYSEPNVLFRFELTEDLLVRIHAESEDADTILALYDADLNELGFNDDWFGSSQNWESLIVSRLAPGTYYLVAGGFWTSTEGVVALEVTGQPVDTAAERQLSLPGSAEVVLTADLPPAGPFSGPGQLFSFTVSETQLVELYAESADVDTVLVLY